MYSDLKQVSGCLGTEVGGRESGKDYKVAGGNFGSDRHVHFLDYDDGFMTVNICQNLSRCTL